MTFNCWCNLPHDPPAPGRGWTLEYERLPFRVFNSPYNWYFKMEAL
jgi:hypothetical protein